jgi:fibronectin type 3 domain-containing protein
MASASLITMFSVGGQAKASSMHFHSIVSQAHPFMGYGNPEGSPPSGSSSPFSLNASYNSSTGMLITPGSVALTWTDNPAAGVTFSIYRSTTTGFTPSAANLLTSGLANTVNTYTDSAINPSAQYFYVVEEINPDSSFGNSSVQASAIVPAMQVILQDVIDINAGDFGTNTIPSTLTPTVNWQPDGAPNGEFTFVGVAHEADSSTITIPATLINPAPMAVYQTEHIGPFTYTIPNLTPNGNYIVNLHFDEDYFTSANQRTSNISINGTQVLTNFDIYVAAGDAAHTANIQSFAVQADNTGAITVSLANVINAGLMSGIEIGISGTPGNPTGPTLIGPPTGLTASPVSAAAVDLNWDASYTPGVTYSVYRSPTPGFTPGAATLIASGLTTTSYQDTTVSGNTTYYYIVMAVLTSDGSTINSNQASVLTPVPNGLLSEPAIVSVAAGDSTYTPVTDTQGNTWITDTANTSYLTVTGGSPAADNNLIVIPDGLLNAAPEVVYQFNRTGPATWVVGGIGPNATQLFQPNTPYIVTLDFEESWWNMETHNNSTRKFNVIINGIQVLTNYDPEYVTGDWHIANVQAFALNSDANGLFTIQTTNGSIDQPLICGFQIGNGTAGVIPVAPTSLTATAVSDSEIDLSWPASTSGPVTYDVYSSTATGFVPVPANLVQSGVTGTTFQNTGLAANTTYYYAVQSSDSFATSMFVTASATTQPLACTVTPTVPGTVNANAVSDTEIDLSWTPSTAPTGCTVTYNVYRGMTSGAESTTPVNNSSIFPPAYADTGLTAGTPYFYVVEAVDAAGSSTASAEGTAATLASGNTMWTLAWGDDFNGAANSTYDHTKWWNEVKVNTGNVWGDSTIQSTSDSLSNVYLDGNGHLVEAMTYNPTPGAGETAYTSARLHSMENIGYGKIEASVQNPSAQGMGAAFWALGSDTFNFNTNPPSAGSVPWPNCGELDMMELLSNNPAHNGSTIHGPETDGLTNYVYDGLSIPIDLPAGEPNFDQAFHTVTTLWGPYHLQYFMDGVQYGDLSLANLPITDIWPLLGPSDNYTINLILSSGAGGYDGTPGTAGFPSNYTFDYVHYSTLTSGAPAPVTALQATQVNSNGVQLSWNASTTPGVTYNIYQSTTQNATLDLSTLIEQNASATTLQVSALNPGVKYYFTVLASNWGGESAVNSSDVVSVTTSAPGNSTRVLLSAAGYAVGNYMNSQYVSGGNTNYHLNNVVDVSQVTNPAPVLVYDTERWGPAAWTIPNLIPGAVYTVRLHFVEAAHTAVQQRAFNVDINTLSVLTNFDIFAAAGGPNRAITQSFQATADGNGEIGIQTLMGTSTIAGIDLNPTVSAIDITPVPPPPAAPVGLTATAVSASEIDLSWPASAGTNVEYLVFRSTTSGFTLASGTQLTMSPIATTTYQDTTVAPSTTYFYLVEATNANGNSLPSNQANATTSAPAAICSLAPAIPVNIQGAATTSSINMVWNTSVVQAGCSAVTYNVFRSTISGFTPATANQVGTNLTTPLFVDSNLNAATTYYYVVEAADDFGSSAASAQAGFTTAALNNSGPTCLAAPAAPASPTGNATSISTAYLSWTAGTLPSGCSEISYTVFRSTTTGFTPGSSNQVATNLLSPSFTDSGLSASTSYYYLIEADDLFGSSTASDQVTVTTGSVPAADFSVNITAPNLTIDYGSSGTDTILVSPINGFSSSANVSFVCSGQPDNVTCNFSPTSVIGGDIVSILTVTSISTTAANHGNSNPFLPGSVLAAALGFLGWKKRRNLLMLMVVGLGGLALTIGCGGTPGSGRPVVSKVTVKATSGATFHSTTFMLTVR